MSEPFSNVYRIEDESVSSQNSNFQNLQKELVQLGLTPNEAKVHIYLSKYGFRRAIEISRAMRIPRTETYELLSSLQNKGLVIATFQHPIKFNAIPFARSVQILINLQYERLRTFQRKEIDLLKLWTALPDAESAENTVQEKFLILEGQFSVYSKAKDMRDRSKKEILVMGYEKDYLKLYHHDFMDTLDILIEAGIPVKFLANLSSNSFDVFASIRRDAIRHIPNDISSNMCFIIVDQSELLFFLNKGGSNNKETLALWTISKSFVDAMYVLFYQLWNHSLTFEPPLKQ